MFQVVLNVVGFVQGTHHVIKVQLVAGGSMRISASAVVATSTKRKISTHRKHSRLLRLHFRRRGQRLEVRRLFNATFLLQDVSADEIAEVEAEMASQQRFRRRD